ncbi:MAG TPA: DciA family protein [Nostocaceae cyanobacterium]|nr:DciA family protein [Nostocaceae cyanobacterium]
MSLKSVNDIVSILAQRSNWQEPPIARLLKFWPEVVGDVVANHTRPLSIQRHVLWVATASAAWAQNLTFERKTLLVKVNQKLDVALVDIRFSTAEWKQSTTKGREKSRVSPQEHPSYTITSKETQAQSTPEDAGSAFERWAKVVKRRSHNLPLCPQCQCPTPAGELQRWSVCSLCAAKQFAHHE